MMIKVRESRQAAGTCTNIGVTVKLDKGRQNKGNILRLKNHYVKAHSIGLLMTP